jgi:hypothetical protein
MNNRTSRRIADRPDPSQWAPDELLTLREAALLFWPSGPITESTLRTAVRDGQLGVATIAGKLFTSPAQIGKLAVFSRRGPSPSAPVRPPTRVGMSASEARALLGDK